MVGTLEVYAFADGIPVEAQVTVVDKGFWSLGDANWDGMIDDFDVELLQEAYGSVPDSPNWNPNCDFNSDGKIDWQDLNILRINYGKKVSQYRTPFTIEVEAGKCVVIAVYDTQEQSRTVEIVEGGVTRIDFVFVAFKLTIDSTPITGVPVTMDGTPVGSTPVSTPVSREPISVTIPPAQER